jgi:hypothetical protein
VTKLKNVRAGIVIIADAGLKLAPGETVSVERPSPQMHRAVDAGLLARIDGDGDSKSKPKDAPRPAEAKPEAADGGQPAPENSGTQAADNAGTTDAGKDDGASVKAAPGVKRVGK